MPSPSFDGEDEEATPVVTPADSLYGLAYEDQPQAPPDAAPAPVEVVAPDQSQGQVDPRAQTYLTAQDAEAPTDYASKGDGVGGQPLQDSMTDMSLLAMKPTSLPTDYSHASQPLSPPNYEQYQQYGDHSADMAAYTAQKAAEAKENTKPSVWRRLGAGLAGGMVAFGTKSGEQGMKVAEEVNGAPLANAQRRWAQAEAPLQAKLQADQGQDAVTARNNTLIGQRNNLAQTTYADQIREGLYNAHENQFNATANKTDNTPLGFTPDDPNNPYAGGTITNADGKTVKGPPPDKWIANWEKSPENQAKKGLITLRAMQAGGIKLTPEQQAIVASGGKVTPSVHTSINIAENPDGSARVPAGSVVNSPDALIAKSMQDKADFANQWTRVGHDQASDVIPEGSYMNTSTNALMSGPEYNSRIESFRTNLNANPYMRKAGIMVDRQGNTITDRFSRNPQVQAPAAAQQPAQPAHAQRPAAPAQRQPSPQATAAKASQLKPGAHILVDGKPAIFKGYDPKTGKIQTQ
jgi:hypothetical protein